MQHNPETPPLDHTDDEIPNSRTNGMSYRSPTEDNRRTTQQVLLPRRSGIHAVMQPGPRIALMLGVIVTLVLYLASVFAPQQTDDSDAGDARTVLPTLTVGAAVGGERMILVSGTGDSGLYLRSAPQRDADVLATVADGTALVVTGPRVTNDGEWLPVRLLDGATGWVAAAYTREK